MWIREDFIFAPHPFPYTVLYGHTPQREIRLDLPYKVGLDTGLVYGNRLSCLELSARELWQIRRGESAVERRSLAEQFSAAGIA
jgi:serine/threonine protein phosphatase 1